METTTQPIKQGHMGPPLILLACIHAGLFVGGLIACFLLTGKAFILPFSPAETTVDFYRLNGDAVRIQSFFLFGSSIPLGLYTATVVSRLNYLGVRAAGVTIALYGGFGTSFFLALAGLLQWVLSHPELATSTEVIRALQDVVSITGGPAHTTLLGLLLAGVAVPSLFMGLLPRWLSIFGLVLAAFGEMSSLSLILPQAMIFIPLARFPGFGWLVLCGAYLPKYLPKYRRGTSRTRDEASGFVEIQQLGKMADGKGFEPLPRMSAGFLSGRSSPG